MSDTKKGNRFVDRTGEIFRTKQGYDVQIIEYNGAKDCSFKFLIEEVVYKNVWFKRLRNTTVKIHIIQQYLEKDLWEWVSTRAEKMRN